MIVKGRTIFVIRMGEQERITIATDKNRAMRPLQKINPTG